MADFEGATIDDIYKAFAKAETGSYDDPWIRTEGYGSSAYGPVQLTGGGGSDKAIRENKQSMMWNVYHDPKMAEKMGITEKDRIYISRFLEQADEFLAPVSDEKGSTYGYGGSGVLTSDEDKASYERVTKKIMAYELDRIEKLGGGIKRLKREWRFGPPEKWDEKDPKFKEYIRKFDEELTGILNVRDTALLKPDEAVMDTILKGVK